MSVLVVGSVAYDSVETPFGKADNALGGSAVYFSAAASFFSPVRLVAVVGEDFNMSDLDFLVVRADYGAILYVPFLTRGYGWIWKNKLPLHGLVFGIGYPF